MLRLAVASILALAAAVAVDQLSIRRGLEPPGFRDPARRLLASLVLCFIFLGVFLPAVSFDLPRELDLESMGYLELFLFQILLVALLAAWYAPEGALISNEEVLELVSQHPDRFQGLNVPVEDRSLQHSGGPEGNENTVRPHLDVASAESFGPCAAPAGG